MNRMQSRNLKLVGHNDLAGYGNGGEGMALHKHGEQLFLYVAQLQAPGNFTVIDVSNPKVPQVVHQTELPHQSVRSNSLAISGDILAVAYQVSEVGLKPAGMDLFDISNPERPVLISHYDTSGEHSRGAHFVWLDGSGFAYLASGSSDFVPSNSLDDQFVHIVDISDPTAPIEAGRWWMPGTSAADKVTPPIRRTDHDGGFRAHNINVYKERPDRAYVAYLDGGVYILDIVDKSNPRVVGHLPCTAPMNGFSHTAVPLFDRDLLLISQESVKPGAADHPKHVWLADISDETKPVLLTNLPHPSLEQYAKAGGRLGAHNIHENDPSPWAATLDRTVVATYFNGGVRVFDISDAKSPTEVAYAVPAPGKRNTQGVCQLNEVLVGRDGLIYVLDRVGDGLYVFEIEGHELT